MLVLRTTDSIYHSLKIVFGKEIGKYWVLLVKVAIRFRPPLEIIQLGFYGFAALTLTLIATLESGLGRVRATEPFKPKCSITQGDLITTVSQGLWW